MRSRPFDCGSRLLKRAYGGFTEEQMDFFFSVSGRLQGKLIVDPMAGQGHALVDLVRQGANVWLGDNNPGPLALAILRDPRLHRRRAELHEFGTSLLKRVASGHRLTADYCDQWLPKETVGWLAALAEALGAQKDSRPFSSASQFWNLSTRVRFLLCLPVLAARQLACFSESDNLTWLKPGGFVRYGHPAVVVQHALDEWREYAQMMARRGTSGSWGELYVRQLDIISEQIDCPQAHAIVTSPPYANRLDYVRMWGPEAAVLSALLGGTEKDVKRLQLGTTVVRGQNGRYSAEASLPRDVRRALSTIRRDPTEFSETYYYPFFRNYAAGLVVALQGMAKKLRRGGVLCMFVRDTVRKDVLFQTSSLVESTCESLGLRVARKEPRIVRRHIGNVRRSDRTGIYGLAQREWWLAFERA